MNFRAVVGWGFYGAATATQRANLWSSWGLMESLPVYVPPVTSMLQRVLKGLAAAGRRAIRA